MKVSQRITETFAGGVQVTHTVEASGDADKVAPIHRAAVAVTKDTSIRPPEIAKPSGQTVGPVEMVED